MNACSTALPRDFRVPGGAASLRFLALLLVAMLMLATGGCATVGAPYAPESSLTARKDFIALKEHFGSATAIDNYYAIDPVTKKVMPETREGRNRFIAGRLVLYDLAYADWISRFRFGRAAESTILDTATLGIAQAITLIGGVETKEALGAISAAILGTRSSYEKNFYDEQTAAAITAQMNAERKAALVPILAGIKADVADYPLTAALIDLTNYQYAGTIDGALSGIHREAGIKETKAMAMLDQYRDNVFGADDATTRLRKYAYPGLVNYTGGKALDASGNEIEIKDEKRAEIMAEVARIEPALRNLPWGTLLNSKLLADLRAKIVDNLQIP